MLLFLFRFYIDFLSCWFHRSLSYLSSSFKILPPVKSCHQANAKQPCCLTIRAHNAWIWSGSIVSFSDGGHRNFITASWLEVQFSRKMLSIDDFFEGLGWRLIVPSDDVIPLLPSGLRCERRQERLLETATNNRWDNIFINRNTAESIIMCQSWIY